ncbi:hypothetical protein I4U23_026108 [Adineta vaga]|nr:hypothetical protein I4U23_026108 [Adineta vaga]
MDFSSEKKWPNEIPSPSAILLNGSSSIHIQRNPARIRHHFVFSLFSALCLCPATGLIALAYSIKSSAKADVNFHDKARLYSRRALFWNILSIVFAIISSIVMIAYFYQLSQMLKAYSPYPSQQKQTDNINGLIQSITNT